MMTMKYLLCVAILAVSLRNIRADDTDVATHLDKLFPIAVECGKDLGVDEETLKKAKESKTLDSVDNCVLACVLKKIEFIDGDGLFDADKAVEQVKSQVTKEEIIATATKMFNNCKRVNEESVGDGEAGCERAQLLIQCLISEHKA